jgi:tetratricopeptide (TPR) repeat protein
MLLQARARIETRFGDQPDIQVRLLSAVGLSLLGLGETAKSIRLFEAAIEIAQRSLPEDDREASRARLRLGEALLTASRPREAKVSLVTALAGMRRLDDAPGIIDALRWTSRLHSQLREPDAAIAAAEEAVNIARARLGPDQLQLALNAEHELLNALQIARRSGQLAPATRVYRLTEALYPDRLVRPKLTAREAYGTALVGEGDASEGVKLLRSALEDAKSLFGPRDRMVGYFAGRLMRGQAIVGDVAGADASARLARQTWDEVHGEKLHSDLAFGRMYEGSQLLTAQRFADAERLLAEAAELFVRIHGTTSRIAPLARSGAGLARARGGDLDGAEIMFGELPASINTFEDAGVRARLGVLRQLQGRTHEAEASLRTALDFLQARAADRFEIAGVKTWLASTLVDLGRHSEAKVLVTSALHVYTSVQPASSPAQAEAWETLARAELGLGDAQPAREASAKAVAFWQAFLPSSAAAVRARLVDAQAAARLGDVEAPGKYRLALVDAHALRLPRDRQLLDETARLVGQATAR